MSIVEIRPPRPAITGRSYWLATGLATSLAAGLATVLCLAPAILLVTTLAAAADEPSANEATQAAIRANVDAFAKAYNAGNAKEIAGLFTHDAQLIDENDTTTQGRDAIEHTFAGIFAAAPQGRIDVEIKSIRLIGTALAIESGTTKVTAKPGDDPDSTHYTVVHTKTRGGKWLMAFAHDTSTAEADSATPTPTSPGTAEKSDAQLTNFERLKSLEWMIGDWIDEGSDSVVISSCKWSPDKNFLLQKIEVRREGRDALDISQRIGWDPLARRIKVWMFDSTGGYGEGHWTHAGSHWRGKATGVRPDGTTSTATNILTPTSKDSYTWQSTDRVVGGEKMPPVEVKVVRKPPEPTVIK